MSNLDQIIVNFNCLSTLTYLINNENKPQPYSYFATSFPSRLDKVTQRKMDGNKIKVRLTSYLKESSFSLNLKVEID